jgi:hypothetical protein
MGLELDTSTTGKLSPNEARLYRRIFCVRTDDGASVEAAHKAALHAVKLWKEVGAFTEEREEKVEDGAIENRFRNGFDALCDYHNDPDAACSGDVGIIAGEYRLGHLTIAEFRKKLDLDRDAG